MADVDVISAQITAVDNASDVIANVGKTSEETAMRFERLQSKMGRRVEATGAVMMTRALRDVAGTVPGVDMALMMLSRSIQALFTSLGPVGWVLIGVTVALTTAKKIIEGMDEASKKLAETNRNLASTYENLAGQLDKHNGESQKYLTIARQLQFEVLKSLNIEYEKLRAKINLEKANEKEIQQLLEYQAKIKQTEIAIQNLTKAITGSAEKEAAAAEQAKIANAEREAMYAEAAEAYAAAINEMEAAEDEFTKRSFELENMVQEQIGSVRAIATMKAINDLAQYKKAIDEAGKFGMNTSKAQADYQAVLEKKTRDYQVKIWSEKYALLADMYGKTADYLYAVGEKIGKAEKLSFEDITKAYVVLWLDAIEQRLKMEFVAAMATADFAKAAMIAAGIMALGIIKGALTKESKAAEIMAEKIEKPEFPEATFEKTKDLTEKAEKVGGKSISTGYNQVINYVTVSPRYEMLDASQLTEARMKEIASQIGKYIMEGMATGQYGLQ